MSCLYCRLFYTAFLDVGTLGEEKIAAITEESFRAMTSNGDVKLDIHIYKLSFLNFLLGKQPNGPGQFIFGSIAPKVRPLRKQNTTFEYRISTFRSNTFVSFVLYLVCTSIWRYLD